ncbi:MAG: glutaredoxin domain-containing protein [Acidobacteriota bacterium]
MDYFLFTYPNCPKCEGLKKFLGEKGIDYGEYSVAQTAGKAKIRDFIRHIKRDATGGIILPTLILNDQGIVRAVVNTAEEMDQWLKSKG